MVTTVLVDLSILPHFLGLSGIDLDKVKAHIPLMLCHEAADGICGYDDAEEHDAYEN